MGNYREMTERSASIQGQETLSEPEENQKLERLITRYQKLRNIAIGSATFFFIEACASSAAAAMTDDLAETAATVGAMAGITITFASIAKAQAYNLYAQHLIESKGQKTI